MSDLHIGEVSSTDKSKYNEDTVYTKIRKYGNSSVFRIYGNQDTDWRNTDPVGNC